MIINITKYIFLAFLIFSISCTEEKSIGLAGGDWSGTYSVTGDCSGSGTLTISVSQSGNSDEPFNGSYKFTSGPLSPDIGIFQSNDSGFYSMFSTINIGSSFADSTDTSSVSESTLTLSNLSGTSVISGCSGSITINGTLSRQ